MPSLYIRNEAAKNGVFLSAMHEEVKRKKKEEEASIPSTLGYTFCCPRTP